jgi:hypothetical protein
MAKKKRELVVAQPNLNGVPAALAYYDPELQNAWNAHPSDAGRLARAESKSKQLHVEYMKQLTKLRPRLSQRTYKRFAADQDSLFDSNLLEFTFGDRVGFAEKAKRTRPRTTVRATFLSFDENTVHELHYRDIEFMQANLPEQQWFSWGRGRQIDRLLAHELTAAGKDTMQHNLLFASGAAISITFARVTWDTRRPPKHSRSRRKEPPGSSS